MKERRKVVGELNEVIRLRKTGRRSREWQSGVERGKGA